MGNTQNKSISQASQNADDINNLPQMQQALAISPQLHNAVSKIYIHCLQGDYGSLQADFQTLEYKFAKSPLPHCLKNTQKFFTCSTCLQPSTIVCENCFDAKKHQGHNFVVNSSTEGRICCCGNEQLSKNRIFCKAHFKTQVMEDEQTSGRFKREMRYLFKLCLPKQSLTEETSQIMKNSQNYLMTSLLRFINDTINHNNTAAVNLQEIIFQSINHQQLKPQEEVGKRTILEEIIFFSDNYQIKSMVSEIIESIVKSSSPKDKLFYMYLQSVLNPDTQSLQVLKTFKRASFRTSAFPLTYLRYFDIPKNCQFYLPVLDYNNLHFISEKHQKLILEYAEIVNLANARQILIKIFSVAKITSLLNIDIYYIENNEANDNINKMNINYSILIFKMIRIIIQKQTGHSFLKQMLLDTFTQIKKKDTLSFNRSLERTFAFLVFELFKYQLPSKQTLEQQVGEISHLIINKLILQSIDFKITFADQYKEFIIKSNLTKVLPKIIIAQMELLAVDELFIKIFSNLLPQNETSGLLKSYVHSKLQETLAMNEFNFKNVQQALRKLEKLFLYFQVPLQTNFAELVIFANSTQEPKTIQQILSNLLLVWENMSSSTFKSAMDKFINLEQSIISFIKTKTVVENKKIKLRLEQAQFYPIYFSFNSQYLFQSIEYDSLNKMTLKKLNKQGENPLHHRFFKEDNLIPILEIWEKCAEAVNVQDFQYKKLTNQINSTIQILSNLYFDNKSSRIRKIIDKLSKRLATSNNKVQTYIKFILEKGIQEEKDSNKLQSQKKKQKLEALKMKQKNALQTYKLEQKCKVDLECIFCKNAQEGEPYLLGHFKYNNFYSKKILQANCPFMEFTTCGHSAHQKCLAEFNKNQFRIWYPCILCKSITNILLPFASAQLNEEARLHKILDFLRNFAANYTFFFQSNKKLLEFSLQDVIGVYKLLFKTMAYSLTIYPISNFSYFQRSQLPILKFIFDLLLFSHKKIKNLTFSNSYPELQANNQFTNIFNYHVYQLQAHITDNAFDMALQRKIDHHRDRIHEDITPLFDQIYQYLTDERQSIDYQLKENELREIIKKQVYRPPEDLKDLRNLKPPCIPCSKLIQQSFICLLCQWACCSNCKDVCKVHSVEYHLGQAVFINCSNGTYTYIHEELTGQFSSIYIDYLGHEAGNQPIIKQGQFTLSQTSWNKIANDIICDRLHKEVMRVHN